MSEYSQGQVLSNGVNIHYERSTPQNSRGSILFLHGVTDNGRCWLRVANELKDLYDVILMDARGHGLSDGPEMGYGVEDRALDAAGLIEALGLSQPVVIGHSMGAETAVGLAALMPDLVSGVVLEDPPWPGRSWGAAPEDRAERAAQWRAEIEQQKALTREMLLAQAHANNPTWHADELGPWAESKLQMSPNLTNLVLAPRRRWTDYVRRATCPLLLITADPERGAIVLPKTVQEAALYWQNGREVNIPAAGHCIHREQFERYMQVVCGFLTTCFTPEA